MEEEPQQNIEPVEVQSPKPSITGRKFISVARIHQGPLPSPEDCIQYEKVLPGAMDPILGMAEKQAEHRRTCELIETKTNSRDSFLGILSAFFIAMSTISGGVYVIINGSPGLVFFWERLD